MDTGMDTGTDTGMDTGTDTGTDTGMDTGIDEAFVVRYRTTPQAAGENQRLIEAVFAELAATRPAGLNYAAYRLADGVTFVHVARGDRAALSGIAAFHEFQRDG